MLLFDGSMKLELRRQVKRRFGQRAVEQRDTKIEGVTARHALRAREDVLRAFQGNVGQAHAVENVSARSPARYRHQERAALSGPAHSSAEFRRVELVFQTVEAMV